MKTSEIEPLPIGGVRADAPRRIELSVYRLLTRLVQPAAGLVLGHRERQGKEDAARRHERQGLTGLVRPPGTLVWVHAASVGEANAVLPLLAALRARRPDLSVLLTTGTVTSARFIAGRNPEGVLHQYVPLDIPAFVERFLDHWQPSLALFTEQEIWPNLLLEASSRRIPLALINARMSDRSFRRWERRAGVAQALFSRFSIVTAQNAALAERFRHLGAGRAIDAGNLKIDAPPPPVDARARAALEEALSGRPRFMAASTHPGEDEVVAAAHRLIGAAMRGLISIIAPRHPERGSSIAGMLAAGGLRAARRSVGEMPTAETDVYIADTIGELGTFYSESPVAFVGGSLVPHGGQNPIEAVRLGAAVITGPHWHNFADAYEALIAGGGAVEVDSAASLAAAATRLLSEPAQLDTQRRNAGRALAHLAGALERTVALLLPLLPEPVPARSPSSAL